MSFSYETDYSQNEIITECSSRLKASGYHIRQEGKILKATAGRDYNVWAIVGCVLLCLLTLLIGLIVLLVYYFTRTQNKIIIDTTYKGKFTIMYEGKKAIEEAQGLSNMLRSSKTLTIKSPICPNCGTQIIEGASYCSECGQEVI